MQSSWDSPALEGRKASYWRFPPATVMAGSDRLPAACYSFTLAILTQFNSPKDFNALLTLGLDNVSGAKVKFLLIFASTHYKSKQSAGRVRAFSEADAILVGEGWNLLKAVLNFGVFNRLEGSNSTEQINLYNRDSLFRQQSSSLSPSSAPASHLTITPEGYSRSQSKILTANSMAELQHSLGWSDGRAQTQGVSESAAVATGLDLLA